MTCSVVAASSALPLFLQPGFDMFIHSDDSDSLSGERKLSIHNLPNHEGASGQTEREGCDACVCVCVYHYHHVINNND